MSNATGVIALLHQLGHVPDEIARAIEGFRGAARRQPARSQPKPSPAAKTSAARQAAALAPRRARTWPRFALLAVFVVALAAVTYK